MARRNTERQTELDKFADQYDRTLADMKRAGVDLFDDSLPGRHMRIKLSQLLFEANELKN
jgi:hypothetical protein